MTIITDTSLNTWNVPPPQSPERNGSREFLSDNSATADENIWKMKKRVASKEFRIKNAFLWIKRDNTPCDYHPLFVAQYKKRGTFLFFLLITINDTLYNPPPTISLYKLGVYHSLKLPPTTPLVIQIIIKKEKMKCRLCVCDIIIVVCFVFYKHIAVVGLFPLYNTGIIVYIKLLGRLLL
jgi:hypothetical protein